MMIWALFLFFLVSCVEAELCYNGGIFDGIKCICDEDLYYGPKCEFLVQESLNVTTSITTSALSGEIRTTPTHPDVTRVTPHSTISNSTTRTAFTTSPVEAFTSSSWSGTKSPSSQSNTITKDPSKNTPYTGALVPSSRSTVSSRPTPGISSSPKTSQSATTSTTSTAKCTSTAANTEAIIASSTITTTTSQICYNGGTFDGIKCLCNEDFFYGPKCEFLLDEILVTQLSVSVIVEAQVKVTNKDYKKSLEDLSSSYSREIQTQFKKQMKEVYDAVPGYRDVEIFRMRNGSIILEHKVFSQVLIENNAEMIQHTLEVITEAVKHSLKDIHTTGQCIEPSGPELCFVPLPDPILNSTVSLNDLCKNITDPKYADYYYPYQVNGTVICVSQCFSGIPGSMNCFNGVCRLSEIGPHCVCNNLDMFWYLDSYCQLAIQKSVLCLSLALTVLFVICIILVICLIKAKRKKSRNSRSDDADCDKIGQRNPIFPE